MALNIPRVTFLGRPVKPVALGLTVAMLTFAWSGWANVGVLDGSPLGDIVGACGVIVAGLLVGAWWIRSQRLAEAALLAVGGLYVTRASFIAMTVGFSNEGFWLSIGTAIIAIGSYWLERADPRRLATTGG